MTESAWPQKHGRLESFLQKLLAGGVSRVTWYEPCIVDGGPATKPSYGFVVLTNGDLYLIDNPPREVRAIIPLSDIIDMSVVHESVLFLKGEDRENAQHIKITFKFSSRTRTENVLRSLSRMSTLSSKTDSSSALSEANSMSSGTSPTSESERKQRKLRKFLMSLSWPNKKSTVHRLENNSECIRSTSNRDFLETSSLASSLNEERTHTSSRLSFSRLLPFVHFIDGRAFTPDPLLVRLSSPVTSTTRLPEKQTVSTFSNADAQNWIGLGRVSSTGLHSVPTDTISLTSNSTSLMSDMTVRSEPIGRSRTVLGNYADHQSSARSAMLRSISDTTESPSLDGDDQLLRTEEELNLYILKRQSGFFRHFKSAWTNCLLEQTLDMDDGRAQSLKTDSREHIEQVLRDLHRKLTSDNSSIHPSENNFVQIRQLAERIQKHIVRSPIAKKMFWKDPHLFPALVNKLHSLVLSPNSLDQHTVGYTMDKIKSCTSLVHILACVLQETDFCPGRPRHLVYRNGQRTKDILTILVTTPWIPEAYRELTLLTVTSYDNFASREWENLVEAPVIRSVAELTNRSTMALYQYFQLSFEGNELASYQNSYGISWMIKTICDVKSVDTFISRVMCQLLLLASSNDHCPLTPAEAVLLHQQVSLLCTFITYSPVLSVQISTMFGEEIRYFVLRQVIGKKVFSSYPIRASLLNSVDALRQAVLQKRTTVSTSRNRSAHPLWITP